MFWTASGLSCRLWNLQLHFTTFSLVELHGLSCSAACGIFVHQPGVEPVSPAFEDGFLTIDPPVKSLGIQFYKNLKNLFQLQFQAMVIPGLWYCLHLTLHLWCFPFQTFWVYRCFYLINLGQVFLASLFPRRQRWEHSLVHFLQGGALRQEEVRAAVLAVGGRLVTAAWFSWIRPLTKDPPAQLPCPLRVAMKNSQISRVWVGGNHSFREIVLKTDHLPNKEK